MKAAVPFGKYLLIDRVNVGGMAEVYKAKTRGVEGFEKLIAIKRILPNIAEDDEFITMFIDEAKISVHLTHANIAQIYDLGKINDSYFIAMEYISGKDLRAIFDRMRKRGEILPVPLTCFCISRVCEGLDYAHRKKDQAGRDLNIVHRDISPQNVLVSFDGEVKLIDFGIAKAANKASKTQAGILKGKFGYMSPEQVRGLPLDRRSDVFAVGVVLYELLTGERLFVGESDFSTLEKVRNVDVVPPSTYNPRIPENLERIVMKALAKDVDDRYQWCNELEDDLQRFLITSDSIFSRKDLSNFLKATFAEDLEREKLRNQEAMSQEVAAGPDISIDDLEPEETAPAGTPDRTEVFDPASAFGGDDGSTTAPGPVAPPAAAAPPPRMQPQPPRQPVAPGPPPGMAPPRGPAPGARLPPQAPRAPGGRPPIAPPRGPAARPHSPPLPPIPLDDGPIVSGSYHDQATGVRPAPPVVHDDEKRSSKLPMTIGIVVLVLAIVGVGGYALFGRNHGGVATAVFIVRGLPTSATVTIDGKTVGHLPYIDSKMKAGEHHVVVKAPGYKTYDKQVAVMPGDTQKVSVHLVEASAPKAHVLVVTVPLDADVTYDGQVVKSGGNAPWQSGDVVAGKKHTIVVKKAGFRPQTKTFDLEAGSDKTFTFQLAPADVKVTVDSVPSHAMVLLDGKKKGWTPLLLPAVDATRSHELVVEHAGCYEPWKSTLLIEGDAAEKTVNATLQKKDGCGATHTGHHGGRTHAVHAGRTGRHHVAHVGTGHLRLNTKPVWATVIVDGKNTGRQTPLLDYALPAGRHQITLRAPNGKQKKVEVTIHQGQVTTRIVTMD